MESYFQYQKDSTCDAESWRSLFENDSPGSHDSALSEKSINPLKH